MFVIIAGGQSRITCTFYFIRWPKQIGTIILYALTLSNINRFSKLFHYQNQEKICNNTITKDPTTPQAGDATDRAIGQWRRRIECVVQQQGYIEHLM